MWASGCNAMVSRLSFVHYRTAGVGAFMTPYRYVFRGNRYPDALNDLQRAMQYVKAHAQEMGIDASRVAAMGFSAGGHLVMSAAELLPREQRPWFVVSVYPVVTMVEPCVHKRSPSCSVGATVGCAISSCVIHYPWSVMCRKTVRRCSWSTVKTTPSCTITIQNYSIRHSHDSMCPIVTYSIRQEDTALELPTIRERQSADSGKRRSWRGFADWRSVVDSVICRNTRNYKAFVIRLQTPCRSITNGL